MREGLTAREEAGKPGIEYGECSGCCLANNEAQIVEWPPNNKRDAFSVSCLHTFTNPRKQAHYDLAGYQTNQHASRRRRHRGATWCDPAAAAATLHCGVAGRASSNLFCW